MKTKITLIIHMFLLTNIVYAQTDELNLQKYWHYRYRLVHQFMVVGPNQGESIPADNRNQNLGWLGFGDTGLQMGWYLGVLATEYKLLSDNNQPVNETIRELYYALHAVERMDLAGESWPGWSSPHTGLLNGYLFGDDVPSTFIATHYNELNYDENGVLFNPAAYSIGSGESNLVNYVSSGWRSTTGSGISFDQEIHLLMGYALISKYVPNNLTFYDLDQNGNTLTHNVNLRTMMINLADNMINYLKYAPNQPHPLDPFSKNYWRLYDPDGNHVSNANGGDARGFSKGAAKAGEFITGINYEDGITTSLSWMWNAMSNLQSIRVNSSTVHMSLCLAAISDSWKNNSGTNVTWNGLDFQGDYDSGNNALSSWSDNHQHWRTFYQLLNSVLYNKEVPELCDIPPMLNSAPATGPYFHGTIDQPIIGWATTRKFVDEPPRQDIGSNIGLYGNYNGLDYMLLHNLYYLWNKNNVELQSSTYPYTDWSTNQVIGDASTPFTIQVYPAFNRLSINNLTVNYNGKLTILGASGGVQLSPFVAGGGPGTLVSLGGRLHITSQSNPCTVNDHNYYFNPTYYHKTKADKSLKSISFLNIFPNPATNFVNVEFSIENDALVSIEIINQQGVLLNKIVNNSFLKQGSFLKTLDVSSWVKGVYFCILKVGNNSILKKLIIL